MISSIPIPIVEHVSRLLCPWDFTLWPYNLGKKVVWLYVV
jgi:hypothetical protein